MGIYYECCITVYKTSVKMKHLSLVEAPYHGLMANIEE